MENSKTRTAKLWILIGVLVAGGIFINWFQQRGEAVVVRKPLAEFPVKVGEWRQLGGEIRFDGPTESVLKTTEYIMREYVRPDGRVVNLYVGYYASQRTGSTYHSPQNCLPGGGWVMREPELAQITTVSGKSFEVNRFIIDNEDTTEVLLYWYQGRGRAVASEYDDKINTFWDSFWHRRSDGAMVRIMAGVGESETEATRAAIDLAAVIAEELSEYIPE